MQFGERKQMQQLKVKERPILFSGPMVRAILECRKTQTRRVIKPSRSQMEWMKLEHNGKKLFCKYTGNGAQFYLDDTELSPFGFIKCPYGKPGDRLWVRERFADLDGMGFGGDRYSYHASVGSEGLRAAKDYGVKWKPSIHMPREASRITLEITNVRVERLQEITAKDVMAEGTPDSKEDFEIGGPVLYSNHIWKKLWESINGPESWNQNPWVWVVEFKKVTP
jgi:hypothetical protein